MGKDSFFEIGKIIGTHGLQGNLKVFPYSGTITGFESGNEIVVRGLDKSERNFIINRAQKQKKILRVSLKGIDTIDLSEKLKNCEILINRKYLPEPEEGTYYWNDIIGLDVFTENGEFLGIVDSIIETGSNDVYVVKNGENEILIPALETVINKVDLDQNKLSVTLPEGL